jgi:hypothetical protein
MVTCSSSKMLWRCFRNVCRKRLMKNFQACDPRQFTGEINADGIEERLGKHETWDGQQRLLEM